ncbi:MAG: competence protein ComEC [Rhodospirillaceae bacterium]|nr:MAG: competence protein ComEC [Rhodospirillaceae bacterium]
MIGVLVAERERWALWLAVALGAGIGLYFGLPQEPWAPFGGPWPGLGALALAVAAVFAGREPARGVVAGGLGPGGGGAGSGTPPGAGHRDRTGVTVEDTRNGRRLTLEDLSIERLSPDKTPYRIRLRMAGHHIPSPSLGDRITLRAKLLPPLEPAAPGAYDFTRQAWFQRLGAVGFTLSPWRFVSRGAESATLFLARWRARVTERLMTGVGGENGAVAAALVTGVQSTIPENILNAYRDSGIAHLLSISGLHMSLAAGWVFVGVRGALALIPILALRHPIKKWTAAVALVATLAYLLLSGAAVPTQQSFLMVALALVAVLLDRTVLSMRTLAWAAVAVLLWQPESLIGPSFQMSFAAVVALIAVYETLRLSTKSGGTGIARRIVAYRGGILLTTLVASTATTPYAAYHFGRITTYALAANLVAVPVTGLVVMPAALGAMLLMPFGLDGPALAAAVHRCPDRPHPGGGLWLCLWRRHWRFWGVPLILSGLVWPFLESLPDLMINGTGRLVAVRSPEGGLLFSSRRGERLAREAWMTRYGAGGTLRYGWPAPGTGATAGLACDWVGCVYTFEPGRQVALAQRPDALPDDCARAEIIISQVPVRNRRCKNERLVIDRFDLWRGGTHVLWLKGQSVPRVETVAGATGNRLWTPARWRRSRTDENKTPPTSP